MTEQENNVRYKKQEELIDITEFITDYLKIFRRMWMWILILTLLGAGISYMNARIQYTPKYTASAIFTINIREDWQDLGDSGSTTFFDNSAAEQMATTFPYILTSGVLREKIAEDMGTGEITANINVSVEENTNLLTISVTDKDAERAYAILQSVIKNYPSVAEVIVGKTSMEMLDETGIPSQPDNPKEFSGAAKKGALLGFMLGVLWSGVLAITKQTVRKEADIRKKLNTKCLGTLPVIKKKRRSKVSKAGQDQLILTNPKIEETLKEPFRIIRNKIEYYAHEYEKKTFLVTSAQAGEGKSTAAVNLALSLAQTGKKVVLIDCDLRHPSDRWILGMDEGPGLGEVLERKIKFNDCCVSSAKLGLDNSMRLLFIPGGEPIEDGSELLGTNLMRSVILKLESWADYVIMDSAPTGLLTDAVVLAQYADGAIFVVRKDFARIDHIMDGMEHLAESKIQIVGAILNGV